MLIVDDFSSDGTSEYLRKRGYAVIRTPEPKGLTHSWNLGYKIAELLGYSSVVMSNNDVLIGHSALEILIDGLSQSALTVPLTTFYGAGHNPAQVIE